MDKKIIIYVLIVLIIIFGIYYFVRPSGTQMYNYPSQNPASETQTSQPATSTINSNINTTTQTQTVSAKTYDISIINFSFHPGTLDINKGDTVVWTNNDSVPHQIKGDTLNNLGSTPLGNGQTYSYTFNGTGIFNYNCAIHPSMVGAINVK